MALTFKGKFDLENRLLETLRGADLSHAMLVDEVANHLFKLPASCRVAIASKDGPQPVVMMAHENDIVVLAPPSIIVALEDTPKGTVTLFNQQPMINALRTLADMLEGGKLRYSDGGIVITGDVTRGVTITSDLVLTRRG